MNDERLDQLIDAHLNGEMTEAERRELEERLLHSAADRARFWELAETHTVLHAPHSIASFLGIAASFPVAASIPLFLIHEYDSNDCGGTLKKSWAVDKNGDSSLPQGPGLGVEVDEAALAKMDPTNRERLGRSHSRCSRCG